MLCIELWTTGERIFRRFHIFKRSQMDFKKDFNVRSSEDLNSNSFENLKTNNKKK